jgi:hypothetical protein
MSDWLCLIRDSGSENMLAMITYLKRKDRIGFKLLKYKNIIRVKDKNAEELVNSGAWKYIKKSEWKNNNENKIKNK